MDDVCRVPDQPNLGNCISFNETLVRMTFILYKLNFTKGGFLTLGDNHGYSDWAPYVK